MGAVNKGNTRVLFICGLDLKRMKEEWFSQGKFCAYKAQPLTFKFGPLIRSQTVEKFLHKPKQVDAISSCGCVHLNFLFSTQPLKYTVHHNYVGWCQN